MHCQCHFGKVKSSVDNRAAATLRYAMYGKGGLGYQLGQTQTFTLFVDEVNRSVAANKAHATLF